MANYASFALSAAWVARRHLPVPDAWLTYSSPATATLPSLIAPTRLRAPSYMIVQDLWPDSVTESGLVNGGLGRAVERTLNAYCNWSYRRSAGIGVISPGMRTILIDRGVDEAKISLTPNWIEDSHLLPDLPPTDDLRRSLGLPTGPLFMYAGNMGELQGLSAVIEAFGRCADVNLALVGGGVAVGSLRQLASAQGARNVYFVESQSADKVGQFIAASDVQIVSLKDSALLRATMPSKVQTSMAAGRPVLAHAAGDVAQLVTQCGAGLAATPGDVGSVVSAIRQFCATRSRSNCGTWAAMGGCEYERSFSPTAGSGPSRTDARPVGDGGRPCLAVSVGARLRTGSGAGLGGRET